MYNLRVSPSRMNVSFKSNNKDKNEAMLPEKISVSLNKLYESAQREVVEYDYFRPVQVAFKNPNKSLYVGEVTLKISPAPKESGPEHKTHRYLEAIVSSPTKGQTVSRVICQGNKDQILMKIESKNFAKELEEFITESSSMMAQDGC